MMLGNQNDLATIIVCRQPMKQRVSRSTAGWSLVCDGGVQTGGHGGSSMPPGRRGFSLVIYNCRGVFRQYSYSAPKKLWLEVLLQIILARSAFLAFGRIGTSQ
jgi:hypothetical protein